VFVRWGLARYYSRLSPSSNLNRLAATMRATPTGGRLRHVREKDMSDTISVDVVGPSYWAYVATVMAECLEEATRSKQVRVGLVPRGVYSDAKEFFRLVLQSVGNGVPDNPPASLNAYVIAADALRNSSDSFPRTREELGQRLAHYSELIDHLGQPRNLTTEEIEIATSLKEFFERLAQAGESEVYERTVDLEPPFLALSFP
jgi:hypothetical protein